MIAVPANILFSCFVDDTATTDLHTLSLHDALPIYGNSRPRAPAPDRFPPHGAEVARVRIRVPGVCRLGARGGGPRPRSEEHTSELQSLTNLVCRLLLEKKNRIHRRQRPGRPALTRG